MACYLNFVSPTHSQKSSKQMRRTVFYIITRSDTRDLQPYLVNDISTGQFVDRTNAANFSRLGFRSTSRRKRKLWYLYATVTWEDVSSSGDHHRLPSSPTARERKKKKSWKNSPTMTRARYSLLTHTGEKNPWWRKRKALRTRNLWTLVINNRLCGTPHIRPDSRRRTLGTEEVWGTTWLGLGYTPRVSDRPDRGDVQAEAAARFARALQLFSRLVLVLSGNGNFTLSSKHVRVRGGERRWQREVRWGTCSDDRTANKKDNERWQVAGQRREEHSGTGGGREKKKKEEKEKKKEGGGEEEEEEEEEERNVVSHEKSKSESNRQFPRMLGSNWEHQEVPRESLPRVWVFGSFFPFFPSVSVFLRSLSLSLSLSFFLSTWALVASSSLSLSLSLDCSLSLLPLAFILVPLERTSQGRRWCGVRGPPGPLGGGRRCRQSGETPNLT